MKLILASDYARFHNITEPEVYQLIQNGKLQTNSFGLHRHPLFVYTDQAPEGVISLDTEKDYLTLGSTAKTLSTNQSRVRDMVKKKVLTVIKVKGYMFIDKTQIDSEPVKAYMKSVKKAFLYKRAHKQ